MALMDKFTFNLFGYNCYPNLAGIIIPLLLVPAGMVLSIGVSTVSLPRVANTRSAYRLSLIALLTFPVVCSLTEIGAISLKGNALLIISVILAEFDVLTYPVVKRTFSREGIPINWN